MRPRYSPRVGSTSGRIETPTAGEWVYEAQVEVVVVMGAGEGEGGWGTPLYGIYGDVSQDRVGFWPLCPKEGAWFRSSLPLTGYIIYKRVIFRWSANFEGSDVDTK